MHLPFLVSLRLDLQWPTNNGEGFQTIKTSTNDGFIEKGFDEGRIDRCTSLTLKAKARFQSPTEFTQITEKICGQLYIALKHDKHCITLASSAASKMYRNHSPRLQSALLSFKNQFHSTYCLELILEKACAN